MKHTNFWTSILFLSSLSLSAASWAQSDKDEQDPKEQKPSTENLNSESLRSPMTQDKMAEIVKKLVEKTNGGDNNLSFEFDGVTISMISNVQANRMRLITPVASLADMSEQQVIASLVSNYHLALDARYALSGEVLVTTYIHPLAELTEQQLISAIRQVATLSKTFGTTYTSGELTFGVEVQTQAPETIDI